MLHYPHIPAVDFGDIITTPLRSGPRSPCVVSLLGLRHYDPFYTTYEFWLPLTSNALYYIVDDISSVTIRDEQQAGISQSPFDRNGDRYSEAFRRQRDQNVQDLKTGAANLGALQTGGTLGPDYPYALAFDASLARPFITNFCGQDVLESFTKYLVTPISQGPESLLLTINHTYTLPDGHKILLAIYLDPKIAMSSIQVPWLFEGNNDLEKVSECIRIFNEILDRNNPKPGFTQISEKVSPGLRYWKSCLLDKQAHLHRCFLSMRVLKTAKYCLSI